MAVTKGTYSIVYSINNFFYSITLKAGSLSSPFSFQNGLDLYHREKKNQQKKVADLIRIWRKLQHFISVKSLRKESVQKVRGIISNLKRLSKPNIYSNGHNFSRVICSD